MINGGHNQISLNINHFANGFYIVKIKDAAQNEASIKVNKL